ncbi:hypothetical protein GQ44DRAFT_618199 [Phaeosphaeriaceae sp. PMI808]|nr:hypothetical protein GQ44DRAFT_618199 [Phaeosphaeriaceae sp. PMI808]
MRFAAVSALLFATLALANPAPVAQPNADVAAIPQPLELEARDPAPAVLEARKKKPKGGSSGNSSAADTVLPSRALQAAALSLGVMELVRLWN